MRLESALIWGSACIVLLASMQGCGGKVLEGDGDDGAGGTAGSGGPPGTGGTQLGGAGGGPAGGGGGPAGSGGYPAGGGGGPAGSGGYPAGAGGGPAGGGGSPGGSGGYPAGAGGGPAGAGGGPAGAGGGPAGAGGAAGGSCWDYLPPSTPCRECLDMNCCGEVINCFFDPQGYCPYAINCYETCPLGDPFECAQMCDGGNFNVPFNDLFTCGVNYCPAECIQAEPPPPEECPVTSGDPQCDNCINSQCAYECNTCMNNGQCVDLLVCLSECSDYQCQEQCFAQFPGGVDDLMAFIGSDGCLSMYCSGPCGF